MEVPGDNSDSHRGFRLQFPASNFIRFPISALLEYSGILRPTTNPSSIHQFQESHSLLSSSNNNPSPPTNPNPARDEVSIRIVGAAEQDGTYNPTTSNGAVQFGDANSPAQFSFQNVASSSALDVQEGSRGAIGDPEPNENVDSADTEAVDGQGVDNSNSDSTYQRYNIQQAARWVEQIIPFALLLLVVFIRQHLQGFFITIWIAGVMYKSNDIVKLQTALKGERKLSVLVGICIIFTLHVVGVYWWFQNDNLLYPLIMLPPKAVPPFWHAIFVVMVNDILVRQAAMVFKCFLLMYYKNSRGRKYRRQGQILTLLEYLLLLYRALLPTPVWYRFFLNKEYGSLFSSLMTGLYLTVKLTSVVEKVQSFFTAVKALSRKDVHYGALATSEQVAVAGDMCAICQEKMHAPILLHCKHIFCEDCVSEWFERERTCPLCRTIVKPADLKSFSDGSTRPSPSPISDGEGGGDILATQKTFATSS
ncbi:hypothetical protein V2J09_010740 [Rumex salicifolius]